MPQGPPPVAADIIFVLRNEQEDAVQQPFTNLTRALAAVFALAFALTGCASSETETTSSATTSSAAATESFPVDVVTGPADSGDTITISEQPTAIISLSPTATESLFAIGAGDQVIAADTYSNYPADAPTTDLSGYEPNIEAILGYSPDLVVAASATEDMIGSLEAAGVPTLVLPSAVDLDDAYGQIERLGQATGHLADAEAVTAQMSTDIQAIVDQTPDVAGTTYFHEVSPSLYTVTSETFIGQVYALFGLTSIAEDTAGDAYPQLSEEFVVDANPDLIFLADGGAESGGVTPEIVAERPGWSEVTAVTNEHVYVLDSDISSRWGPRVVDLVQVIGDHVAELES